MHNPGSVTRLLPGVQAGDEQAIEELWKRYFHRLVALGRDRLGRRLRRFADGEDVALSAFASFCQRAREAGFPNVKDRDDLWKLLAVITLRKAFDLASSQLTQKRGAGLLVGESALERAAAAGQPAGLDAFLSREPTPEFLAETLEQCERLLAALSHPTLRKVAIWKLEGYSNEEIALELACSTRTVERKLWVIRETWTNEVGHGS